MFKLRDNKISVYQAKSKVGVTRGEVVAPSISRDIIEFCVQAV